MASRERASTLLSEGVLLAGGTLIGYAVALAREAGYARYFNVPLDIISVDLVGILIAIAALLGVAGVLFVALNLMGGVLASARLPRPVAERISLLTPLVLFAVASIYMYGCGPILLFLVVMLLISVCVDFGLPLITHRKVNGYLAKLEAHSAEEGQTLRLMSPHLGSLVKFMGPLGTRILMWLAFAIFLAYLSGQADATRREWFFCPTHSPDVVLVRTYGSMAVGARFDRLTHHLDGELVLGVRGEGEWTNLKWAKVGPLERFNSEATEQAGK